MAEGWVSPQAERARSSTAKGEALQMWMGHRVHTSAQDLTHGHIVILEGGRHEVIHRHQPLVFDVVESGPAGLKTGGLVKWFWKRGDVGSCPLPAGLWTSGRWPACMRCSSQLFFSLASDWLLLSRVLSMLWDAGPGWVTRGSHTLGLNVV